jgi:hypothetical protein
VTDQGLCLGTAETDGLIEKAKEMERSVKECVNKRGERPALIVCCDKTDLQRKEERKVREDGEQSFMSFGGSSCLSPLFFCPHFCSLSVFFSFSVRFVQICVCIHVPLLFQGIKGIVCGEQ